MRPSGSASRPIGQKGFAAVNSSRRLKAGASLAELLEIVIMETVFYIFIAVAQKAFDLMLRSIMGRSPRCDDQNSARYFLKFGFCKPEKPLYVYASIILIVNYQCPPAHLFASCSKKLVHSRLRACNLMRILPAAVATNALIDFKVVVIVCLDNPVIAAVTCIPNAIRFALKRHHAALAVIPHFLPLPLAFDVLLDYLKRCAANAGYEVRRTPKVSTPKAIFESRELLKQSPCGHTLKAIDELGNLMVGLDTTDHVYVVNFVLSRYQFNISLFAKLFKQLSASIANLTSQHRAPILHTPNDVDSQQVNRMATRLKLVFHLCDLLVARAALFLESAVPAKTFFILRIWLNKVAAHNIFSVINLILERLTTLILKRTIRDTSSPPTVSATEKTIREVRLELRNAIYLHTQHSKATNSKKQEKSIVISRKIRIFSLSNQSAFSQALSLLKATKFLPRLKSGVSFGEGR